MLESDELLAEHARLVGCGVRTFALVGHDIDLSVPSMTAIATKLEVNSAPGAIPFVIPTKDGRIDYGYASRGWAIELYAWLVGRGENPVPEVHRHRILGLLLGYDAEAIRCFEERGSGLLFPQAVTAWPERAAR